MKIGIIGGGASGLVAAIKAKKENNEVIIFEKNKECGKKILATGNGRCNYWNSDQDLEHYESSNRELIQGIINSETEEKVLGLFNKLGIVPKIKNGYYYPFSNQASTIRKVLLDEVLRLGVTIKNEFSVQDIKHINDKFIVCSDNEEVCVDKLILATGSFAAPKTGSDGMGFNFLKKFNHTIIKPLPSLVQLITDGGYLKEWNGIRTDVNLFLYEDDNLVKREAGEIQLTNYGISGICVFNLSNYVARGLDNGKKEVVSINFLPFLNNYEEAKKWFYEKTLLINKNIKDLLEGILNYNLVSVILRKANIADSNNFNELDNIEQERIIKCCISFKVNVVATKTFEEAQVASGGVNLTEINLQTMESKLIKNLFITGELLDLTGDCGGYNLGIAWRTGYIAGEVAGDENA